MCTESGQGRMMAVFDFIITEMDFSLKSLKSVSDLNWKNIAGPKTENSFWSANFVFDQLRHIFSLKISQFRNFQSLPDEFGNYFSDSRVVCNFATMGNFLFVLVMEYLSFYAMCPLFKTLLFRYNFDLFYEKIQVQCMYIVSKLMNKLTFLFFCNAYITS